MRGGPDRKRDFESILGLAGAFAESLSLTLQRTNAELLHETQDISIVPLFLNLAVYDAVDGNSCNRDRSASRGNAHHFALVSEAT